MNRQVSNDYINAFFEYILHDKTNIKTYHKKISEFYTILHENDELVSYVSCLFYPKKIRKSFVKQNIDNLLNNFIYILIDDNIASNIVNIFFGLKKKIENFLGMFSIKIIVRFPLSKVQINKLIKTLKEKTGKTPIIEIVINNNVIGGIKIISNNLFFDNTLESKLNSYINDR